MKQPKVDPGAKVMKGAVLIGDVEVADGVGIWYNAVLRGDLGSIRIGPRSNIQDGCILHVDHGDSLTVGTNVTVGHATILHGCTLEDGAFVGMGCAVMNGAILRENCLLGAGSLVTEGTEIPAGMLAFGRPAKPVRPLTKEEIETNLTHSAGYVKNAALACQIEEEK